MFAGKSKRDDELLSLANSKLQRQLEENLKLIEQLENQKKFNNKLIQSTSAFFVAIDSNGKLIMMNDPMLKALGYTKRDVLGKDYLTTFVPEEEREELKNIFSNIKHRLQNTLNRNHVLSKDGSPLFVEWHGSPIFKDDKFDYFIGLGIDITKREKAEKRVELFSKIFEESLNEIYIFDSETYKFLYVNKGAQNNIGYQNGELLKLTPLDIKPEFTKESFEELLKPLVENKEKELIFETVHKRKDGSTYDVEVHIQKTNFENHKVFFAIILDITARKQNFDKLKKSEAKFKLLLDNLPNSVFITKIGGESSGQIIYANPTAAILTGYKQTELIGMNIIDDFFVDDKTIGLREEREYDLSNNKILSFVEKKKRADGSIYLAQVMIAPIEYENEKVALSVNTDITAQIEAQEKIKESEKKYKSLFENNLAAVFMMTLDGEIIESNSAFYEMFGYMSKEDIFKVTSNIIYPSKTARKYFLNKIKENKTISNFEINGLKKDGSSISTLINANLISDNIIQGTIFNITDRKKYQAEISKLSKGIEQSPNMIIITDLEGNIEYANRKITEVTGYSKEELIGKNPRIFQSGKTPNVVYEELWDTILYGKTWEGELLNKRKNGELYWESVTISPIIDNEGNILNYIGIKDDITEKKKNRLELIKSKEKAEEMYKIKSNFLANMSHELRTPLVGILGFTEILEEDIDDPENKKIASLINENGKRLLETLNLILNLSKLESETLEIEFSEFDVIKEINRSAKLFEENAKKKNISLNVTKNVDKLIIHSDVRIFYDIINNLINNAIKYTNEGSVNIIIDLSKNNKYAVIKVVDTGIGIPKDKQDIIWEEFRQVSEGTTRLFEGTGLGLTITNKYIKKLKGKISLESVHGHGSTFTVSIPTNVKFYPIKNIEPKPLLEKTDKPADSFFTIKPRLLYVEDDKIAVDIVKRFLQNNFEIFIAKDGLEGLVKVKNKIFDIILMDIDFKSSPNGIELAKHIRKLKEYKSVPIIAVSAYSISKKQKEYLDSGFTSYLAKPFSKEELINELAKFKR